MKIKSKLGYIWAAMGIPIMLAIIMSTGYLTNLLFIKPGVTYSEGISGGKIQAAIDHKSYRTQIHKPVFEGYFKDTKEGYVQIDWITEKSFPALIVEDVDYNSDGKYDFKITVNTVNNSAQLIPSNNLVKSISTENVMVLEKQRTVRINLRSDS